MTRLEFEVLAYLAQRARCVVTYAELWAQVWSGQEPLGSAEREVVRAVLKRLRKKLGYDPERPEYLVSAHGVGVRLRRRRVTKAFVPVKT